MADADEIAIVDFVKEHLKSIKSLAEGQSIPAPGDLSPFERAQMKVIMGRIESIVRPQEADTFDEEEEDIPLDPIIFTSTTPGLVAGNRVFKDYQHVTMLDEQVWRKWVQETFQGEKPMLRGFKRHFMYFTSVLGELDVKEQVSGMRLKGTQYLQLHEGKQLTLTAMNIKESSWSWDSSKLEPSDDEDED